MRTGHGVARRQRAARSQMRRGLRRRAVRRRRQVNRRARRAGDRRIAALLHRGLRRRAFALRQGLRMAERAGPAARRRRIPLSRPSHAQRDAREHGHLAQVLLDRVQLQGNQVLRHQREDDRPDLAGAYLALRQDQDSDQRELGREQPDRGVPSEVQRRRHPAHRRRNGGHLRLHRQDRRQRNRLHAAAALRLL